MIDIERLATAKAGGVMRACALAAKFEMLVLPTLGVPITTKLVVESEPARPGMGNANVADC